MGWFSNLFTRKVAASVEVKAAKNISGSSKKSPATSENKSVTKGMVNVAVLNARSEPSQKGDILYKLKKHTVVTITEDLGQWYHINTEAGAAYCMSSYINKLQSVKKILVNAQVLNVRNFHSTDATILGKIYKGNIYVVISEHSGWYGIDLKGKTGYVASQYVSLLDDGDVSDSMNSQQNQSDKSSSKSDSTVKKAYFYQREDLAGVTLAPVKQLPVEGGTKEKIAAKTWNNYGNLISTVSKELGIEVEAALAVLCVESGGSGFGADGKMIIRFENHVFYSYWGKKSEDNQKSYDKYFSFDSKKTREDHKYRRNKSDDWIDCHTGQACEWEVFSIARGLAEKEAMFCISMGAPQVMGFNYKSIGYTSVQEMFEFFSKDIRYHLLALFDFCNAKSTRIQYLLTRDFLSFAKEYNGLTAPEAYEKRILEYYDIFKNIL